MSNTENMRNPETARRLKEAMEDKNISSRTLSEKAGVSESSISQYLHGLFAPKNKTAAKLADVLQVNPMWLMGFDVKKEIPDPFGFRKMIAEENERKEKEKQKNELVKNLMKQTGLEGTDVSNADFVLDMDLLSQNMTLKQMDQVKAFAQFIKDQPSDEDPKKKNDE